MATRLNLYINFKDRARQAMEFYQSVFGGKLTVSTFGEYNVSSDPVEANKIMHAQLETDNGIFFMAADSVGASGAIAPQDFSVSLSGENEAELSSYYHKLSEGGTITEPLAKSPWGDTFGMFTDKFGVNWMVNITAPKS